MTGRIRLALVALATVVLAVPGPMAEGKHKRKKHKPSCTVTATVSHGTSSSTLHEHVKCRERARGRALRGALVEGTLTQVDQASGSQAGEPAPIQDTARTNKNGKATLDLSITHVGPKEVTVVVTARNFTKLTITKTFIVTGDEGKLSEQ